MTTHTLKVTWPITDPDMPLNELRAEATDQLRSLAATRGWTYTGHTQLHINHGEHPTLTATVNVHTRNKAAA